MGTEHPARSTLTVNRSFIRDFLAAESPCFALGLVEARRHMGGFLALRPPTVIPPAITDAGFRFGHALLGNADFVVVQFVFAFYGFETYNVLVNPNNLLVRTVVTTMVQNEDAQFITICSASTLANELILSSPFQSQARDNRRASATPMLSPLRQSKLTTNSNKLSNLRAHSNRTRRRV